ncbi:unnamed protein product [Gadus morhua 'NCC']
MKGDSEESIESTKPSNLQAFANISTLHGMSHIFAYGHMTFRRFLWTLSFLGSLSLLLLVCMDRVTYYFEYPHITKLDEVAAPNLTFPAVTFCNLNEFRFSQITKNDLYHVGELLSLLNSNYQIANTHLAEPEVLASLKDKANFQNFKPKLFNMTDFYNRTGHDISDMLLQCTFRGEECHPSNFTTMNFIRHTPPGWIVRRLGRRPQVLRSSIESSNRQICVPQRRDVGYTQLMPGGPVPPLLALPVEHHSWLPRPV